MLIVLAGQTLCWMLLPCRARASVLERSSTHLTRLPSRECTVGSLKSNTIAALSFRRGTREAPLIQMVPKTRSCSAHRQRWEPLTGRGESMRMERLLAISFSQNLQVAWQRLLSSGFYLHRHLL